MPSKISIFIFLLILVSDITFSQVSSDSLFKELDKMKGKAKEIKRVNAKIHNISNSLTKVQILQTCSTEPQYCGVVVTASLTMAKIINGLHTGDTILIAATCERTNYEFNKVYSLNIDTDPSFGVILCSGKAYSSDWNYNLDKNKYLIFFGRLIKSSKW